MVSPVNPRDYIGIQDYLVKSLKVPRAPTVNDIRDPRDGKILPLSTIWIDTVNNDPYVLVDLSSNQATWNLFSSPGSSLLQALTGNSGGTISPDGGGNINITGNSSQGVSTAGTPGTNTIQVTVADATDSTKGVSQFNSNDFVVSGGTVSIKGSAATETYQADSGSATPSNNITNVIGGEGMDTSASGNTITISGEDATAAASSGAANKGICSFNSADFTVMSGFVSLTAPSGINTVQTDSGSASPSGGILQFIGGEGIDTAGATNIVTISGEDATAGASAGLANKGIASFSSANFSVASGFVTLSGSATTNSYVTDSGSATPSGGVINVIGGNGIATSGASNNVTVDMESPFTGDFTFQSTSSGDTEILRVTNTSNTASSQAQLRLDVAGTSAGDSFATFEISGGTSWAFGVDNSDSDRLKISRSTTLGTNDTVYWDSTGQVMPSGFGITFNTSGGSSGTSTSNKLEIFEEGTFNPTITGSVVSGTGTYVDRVGRYQRIGNRSYINVNLAITAHTGSGEWRCSIPFTGSSALTYTVNNGDYTNSSTALLISTNYALPSSTSYVTGKHTGETTNMQVENAPRNYNFCLILCL
jgi:hypothetical protein